jgi:hypothetical protein
MEITEVMILQCRVQEECRELVGKLGAAQWVLFTRTSTSLDKMNDLESQEATAQELVAFAKQRGVDLSSACHDFAFFNGERFILLWRKEGKVHYNMQGSIGELPKSYKASASAFRGMWHEAGTLLDLEQAFELLKAWLVEMKGVDDLPKRTMKREGIG